VVGVGVAPFQNTTTTEYHQMVNNNTLGLLYSIHATLPTMKARQRPHRPRLVRHRLLHPRFNGIFRDEARCQRHS
jgi:hypothetical protein